MKKVFRRIAREYLSGHKISATLARKYGLRQNSVSKIVSRYCQKNNTPFAQTHIHPIMPSKKVKPTDLSALAAENERLTRQLKLAQLTIEGYQIMGDILEEEYWGRLIKKAEAERVNGILKDEWCSLEQVHCFEQARDRIDQIVKICNDLRPHLSCAMKTPTQRHRQAQQLKVVGKGIVQNQDFLTSLVNP